MNSRNRARLPPCLAFVPRAVNRLARYLRRFDQEESPDVWKVCCDFLSPACVRSHVLEGPVRIAAARVKTRWAFALAGGRVPLTVSIRQQSCRLPARLRDKWRG